MVLDWRQCNLYPAIAKVTATHHFQTTVTPLQHLCNTITTPL
jgi:hypothetical protein